MFDAPVQPPLNPTPSTIADVQVPTSRSPNAEMVRGLMALVLMGVVIVVIALLVFRWPILGRDNIPFEYGSHPQRLSSATESESSRGVFGIIVDASVYVMLLAVLVFAIRTLKTGSRHWLGALVILGLLGLAYVIGMVLYIGPMISACGFSLIVFGSLVAWIAADQVDNDQLDHEQSEVATPLEDELKADNNHNEGEFAPGT